MSPIMGNSINYSSRNPRDFYPTPSYIVEELIKVECFEGTVWEPCCGSGGISYVFESHGMDIIKSDIYPQIKDCIKLDFLLSDMYIDCIVCNPPYRQAFDFIKKAVVSSNKCAFLLRWDFIGSLNRYKFFVNNPPSKVYIIASRLKYKDEFGKWNKSSQFNHSWIIWDRKHIGITGLSWIEGRE